MHLRQTVQQFGVYVKFVVTGRLLAYAIVLIATPVVMRFFPPDAYGTVTLAIMTGTMLAGASTLAFEKASIVIKDSAKSGQALHLAALCAIGFTLFLTILMLLFYLFGSQTLLQSLNGHFIIASMFCEAIAAIVIADQVAKRNLTFVSRAEVIQATTTSVGRVLSGLFGYIEASVLFLWYSIGVLAKIVYLRDRQAAHIIRAHDFVRTRNQILSLAREYSDFPIYNVPTGLLHQLGNYLPIFVFGIAYGPSVAAFYAVSRRFLKAPSNVFVNTLRPVLVKDLHARIEFPEVFNAFLFKLSLLFALIGLLSIAGIWIFANLALAHILNDEWVYILNMLNLMLPTVLIPFITLPLNAALIAKRRQRIFLAFQVKLTIVRVTTLMVALLASFSWQQCAFVYAIVSTVVSLVGVVLLQIRQNYLANDEVKRS